MTIAIIGLRADCVKLTSKPASEQASKVSKVSKASKASKAVSLPALLAC